MIDDWFEQSRFGLFIHWGLYSLAARHEWVMAREKREVADYEKYATYFQPDLFDAKSWARQARKAGMKYVVLTAKHHDGFCLWDSQLTDYTSVRSPFGRDIVREYVEAARAEGLRVGLYYSLLDWHHPDFTIDGIHPLRDKTDRDSLNSTRVWSRYRDYLHGQVRELLTEYGTIDYLFFDFSYDRPDQEGGPVWNGKGSEDWDAATLMATVRELQPNIIVNDRLGIPGDLVTPEQYQPDSQMTEGGEAVMWEACQTLNGSWGYDRDNNTYKSPEMLLALLVDGVSKNGNLLLNVGPTARGEFEPRAVQALEAIGDWMTRHSRSIIGAGASEFAAPHGVRYTQRENRLYVHVFDWPLEFLHLPDIADRVVYAQLLNDASEIERIRLDPARRAYATCQGGKPEGTLTLRLPIVRPGEIIPVIELFLGQVEQTAAQP